MSRRFDRLDDVWPAGLGRRLGAMLYDALLVLALWIVIGAAHVAVSRLLWGIPPERIGLGAGPGVVAARPAGDRRAGLLHLLLDPRRHDAGHGRPGGCGCRPSTATPSTAARAWCAAWSARSAGCRWARPPLGAVRRRTAQLVGPGVRHPAGGAPGAALTSPETTRVRIVILYACDSPCESFTFGS